ncbi:Fe(2+) transport protein 2 [Hibiscus syriacus]|uniref:Fe(2+) transport protein 2 n=1 Tax=Hibiscus syriacus TaxID=106335 RepID=A0A6A3AR48_HIBSY|nr:fe(2+) transport protein 1-like [Hibiscus syriacus]KAE8705389.1 Fe(2+) transport protein 2 [Hibiscus syriacus]
MKSLPKSLSNAVVFVLFIILSSSPFALAKCEEKIITNGCHDERESMKLKLIALVAISVSSVIGVCLPLLSHCMPSLTPDSDMFAVLKAFTSGVILATGYMHVLPDSFSALMSDCLPRHPWKKFPFTAFVAMMSALLTLMVDSFSMSVYKKLSGRASEVDADNGSRHENGNVTTENYEPGHGHGPALEMNHKSSQLLRHRVIAQVLELGIVVHSVVIGLAMGASDNRCTIRPLIAALCFHQMFEGIGLGGCILQAEYEFQMKAIMVFFFSVTTPLGIVIGIGLTKVYSATSPTALIVVGLLNASSAGLLNYMALVDLLAADFLGPKLQKNMKLQAWSYVAVLLGSGFMSLMAKWA